MNTAPNIGYALPRRTLLGLLSKYSVQIGLVLAASIPIGCAVALINRNVGSSTLAAVATSLVLALPVACAATRLRSGPEAIAPILVALMLPYFFVPRLLDFDPTRGLLSHAGLTPAELAASKSRAELVLIAFALPMALVFQFARRRRVPTDSRTDQLRSYRTTIRLRTAITLGTASGVIGIAVGLAHGVSSRNFQSGGSSSTLVGIFGPPIPAALWLAGRRRLSVALLVLVTIGPYLQGGRQSALTPILLLALAVVAARTGRTNATRPAVARVAVLTLAAITIVVGVAAVTTLKRSRTETAENGGVRPSVVQSLVNNQTLLDPLMVAIAREKTPQGFTIYERVLAAPIPRLVWPQKPFSYDYDFRARHFPEFGDAIPVSLVGTSYVSFLLPGAAAAGALLALLAVAAERLLRRHGQRAVLLGGALTLFAIDLLRVGGLYRELLTFAALCICIFAITRRSANAAPAPATSVHAITSEVAPS